MSKELVPVEDQERTLQIFDMKPHAMVASATEIANVLSNVIDSQGLFSNIQGNKYVRLEGWNLLGSLLGILPRERNVIELADGSYEATVELVSTKTGAIVGCGSALCSVTEKRWGNAEKFARRSMCITRATAKAYRLGMSWIINLAGYEATPFEEMDGIVFDEKPSRPSKPKKKFEVDPEPYDVMPEPVEPTPDTYTDTPDNKRAVMNHFANLKLPLDKEQMLTVHQMMLGKPTDAAEKILVDFCKELEARA